MKHVWLASYPKSGNTWFRMLIAALSAGEGRPFDINDLAERTPMGSARHQVDQATMIDSALLTHDEADVVRSRACSAGAMDRPEHTARPRFSKVHDAYLRTRDGEPVLGRPAESGAIVLVRDPRDVAPSLAAHFNRDLDWTVDYMGRDDAAMSGIRDDRTASFRQRLGTWSAHVTGWLDQPDVPVHCVKYESLLVDTVGVFMEAMRFAGRPVTLDQARQAADRTAFEKLQAQERAFGFVEGPGHGPFFRRGRAGGWRDVLTPVEARRIEADHGAAMARLGYATSSPLPGGGTVEFSGRL